MNTSPAKTAKRNETSGLKQRVLIFIVAYNAESTIRNVLTRVPVDLNSEYEIEVLIIDDASHDKTFDESHLAQNEENLPFPVTILFNPENQGYGGNQKIGFHYAIEQGFDFVALVHGDGQYAPECLPDLLRPLASGDADAVFGSRMLTRGGALAGGMPLYKYVGNKILTGMQNRLLRSNLSEFHSGYRLYSVEALRKIPFELNSNVFHFDTDIIIQLLFAKLRIRELPIPTYYGNEICNVDGLRYAWDVTKSTIKARLQEYGFLYERKFDCTPNDVGHGQYLPKLDFPSPHTEAISRIDKDLRVLDIGGASGYLGRQLRERGCTVTGIDLYPPVDPESYDAFHQHDLNIRPIPIDFSEFDVIVMLDVIEHLTNAEEFVDYLRTAEGLTPDARLLLSTGNVAFGMTRFSLLIGQFNYGKRGILDLTHTRLFTIRTISQLFEQAGFEIISAKGIPAPFPLALGEKSRLGKALLWFNQAMIRIWPSMFSYQVFLEIRNRPLVATLLKHSITSSEERRKNLAR